MKNFVPLFLCLSIGLFNNDRLAAQQDYLVTNEMDTLYGIIDFNPKDTANHLVFRKNRKAKRQSYSADQVKSFQSGPLHFVSLDTSRKGRSALPQFMVLLVKGKLSLYKHQDRFFYLRVPEGRLVKLDKRPDQFYGIAEDQRTYRRDYRYREVMAYILQDCPKVAKKAKRLDYHPEDLTAIVVEFNQCQGDTTTSYESPGKIKVRYGLKAGGGMSTIKYLSGDVFFADNKFRFRANYSAGIFLNFSTNNKRWSVQPELRLIRKGGYSDEPSDNYDYRVRVDYDFLYVNIPVSIQYNFPHQWGTPYILGGATVSLGATNAEAYINTASRQNIPNLARDEYGWRTGAGLRLPLTPRLQTVVEYEYEQSIGNKNSIQHTIRNKSHQLTLAIMFGH